MHDAPLEPSAKPTSSALGPIAVLSLIALALKLVVLAMPPEEISPGGVPDAEEWRRGVAAAQWLKGSLLHPLDLQIGHFQGGTLLTVALVAISFAVFGESALTMRLANVPCRSRWSAKNAEGVWKSNSIRREPSR